MEGSSSNAAPRGRANQALLSMKLGDRRVSSSCLTAQPHEAAPPHGAHEGVPRGGAADGDVVACVAAGVEGAAGNAEASGAERSRGATADPSTRRAGDGLDAAQSALASQSNERARFVAAPSSAPDTSSAYPQSATPRLWPRPPSVAYRKVVRFDGASYGVRPTEEDGNCLFRTSSMHFYEGDQSRHKEMREIACSFIADSRNSILDFAQVTEDGDAVEDILPIDAYVRNMRQPRKHGGQQEITALSIATSTRIIVYDENESLPPIVTPDPTSELSGWIEESKPPMELYRTHVHGDIHHYELLERIVEAEEDGGGRATPERLEEANRQAMDTIADSRPEDPGAPVVREEFNLLIEVLKQQQNQVLALHRMRLEESMSDGGSSDEDSSSDSDDEDSSDDDDDDADAAVNAWGDADTIMAAQAGGMARDACDDDGISGPELLDLQIDLSGTQHPRRRGAIPRHVRTHSVEERAVLRRMINDRRVWECTAGDDSSVDSATTAGSADFRLPVRSVPSRVPSRVVWSARPKAPSTVPLAPGGVPPSMASAARAAGVEAAAASITRDDEGDNWELKKIFDVTELGTAKPQMCQTELCDLQACSKWVAQHDTENPWFSCVDCQEKDYEGWPTGSLSDALPIEYLTEDTYTTIVELCSKQNQPVMPDVPIATALHRVAPQALPNTEGWVVDVDFTVDGVFRGKILRAGRDEQGAQRVTIAWDNGEASSVFSHPDETKGIWLLYDDGKLMFEESDEEAPEPSSDEDSKPAAKPRSNSGQSEKTARQRALKMPAYDEVGQDFIRWMRKELLSAPQLLEATDEVMSDSVLNAFEDVLHFGLRTLDAFREDNISEEDLIDSAEQFRTRLGDVICATKDGKYAKVCNTTQCCMPGNDGKATVWANYPTEDDLGRQGQADRRERNLSLPHTPCLLPFTQSGPRGFVHEATEEKSDVVCTSIACADLSLIAFDLEDTSTPTAKLESYWKAIDGLRDDLEVSRGKLFLGSALLIYLQGAIYKKKTGKAMPLLLTSKRTHLECLNCAQPQVTNVLNFAGNVWHGELWISDLVLLFSDEAKDEVNAILSRFYIHILELELPAGFLTNIAHWWGTSRMTDAQIEERKMLKREGGLKALRNSRLRMSIARGARQRGEQLETQQNLLLRAEAGLPTGPRSQREESSKRLGMERAADSQVIEMKCQNPACTHNEVRRSEWTYEGKAVVEVCNKELKNGDRCKHIMKAVSANGLKTISRDAVFKRNKWKEMSEEEKEADLEKRRKRWNAGKSGKRKRGNGAGNGKRNVGLAKKAARKAEKVACSHAECNNVVFYNTMCRKHYDLSKKKRARR